MLAVQLEHAAAGDQHGHVRRGLEQIGDQRRSGHDVFEIIEQQQQVALAQVVAKAGGRLLGVCGEAQRLGNRGRNQRGVGERRERDEKNAVGEVFCKLGCDLEREPTFANAAWPGQRQQAHIRTFEQRACRCCLAHAANQRG